VAVAWNIRGVVVTLTITTRTNSDLRRAIVEAMSSPGFPSVPAVLLDMRSTTENPAPDVLRLRAGWIATLLSRRYGSRCALVIVSEPHHYGLARMLCVLLESEGFACEVFTEIRDARRWLRPGDGRKAGGAAG
jgi:hypothetical protein